jgi:hypothetical protein
MNFGLGLRHSAQVRFHEIRLIASAHRISAGLNRPMVRR